ncbi:Rab GTPase-activating protein 1 [Spathaspora sp. JA1]|nr:Rab GTPase-activating protein 1 [Spathaspora sp. JA1]
MIDYDSLLEFEEALSQASISDNVILLQNLEIKIDFARSDEEYQSDSDDTHQDLESILNSTIAEYKIQEDEFATCKNCGGSLTCPTLYKSCCHSFVDRDCVIGSKLEESYWLSFLENPTRTINTLPNYTEFLCLKQGIPNPIRCLIWKKLFLLNGNIPQSSKFVYQNFQHSYYSEVSKQISKDLGRTFPSVKSFGKQETINNLSTILNVYANYDLKLGYCQGLLFLVGVLYFHLNSDCELTFHALINIMETEPELHDIFTTSTMSETLNCWFYEFCYILKKSDPELYTHLTELVEMQTFLYQWWLSFMSSHSPDLSIVNRSMDFCLFQGWKVGLFKISLGLLISNKPILMTLTEGDEEVIYQHLLNESKWGNVINDLDRFFGDVLFSWDDTLFLHKQEVKPSGSPKSILNSLKTLTLKPFTSFSATTSPVASIDKTESNRSSNSVFSSTQTKNELESICSDASELSQTKSFSDYLKLPYLSPRKDSKIEEEITSELMVENEVLRSLLKKAYLILDDDGDDRTQLRQEIAKAVEV